MGDYFMGFPLVERRTVGIGSVANLRELYWSPISRTVPAG